jgi:hypothetical protein
MLYHHLVESFVAAMVMMVMMVSAEEEKDNAIFESGMKIQSTIAVPEPPEQKYPSWLYWNPSSSSSLASVPVTWQRGLLRGTPPLVTTTSNATNVDDAEEVFFGEYYEKTEADHRRMIFMILFFLGFMVLYIGFCAYYRKRNKVRRAVEDNTVRTRERQRSANQVRRFFYISFDEYIFGSGMFCISSYTHDIIILLHLP